MLQTVLDILTPLAVLLWAVVPIPSPCVDFVLLAQTFSHEEETRLTAQVCA